VTRSPPHGWLGLQIIVFTPICHSSYRGSGFYPGRTNSCWTRQPLLDAHRDSKYSLAFRTLLERSGVEIVRLPSRSPNLNAYAERFVRSIKSECLGRMIFFGERSLRKATREYAAHYHGERNHQGLDNRLIEAPDDKVSRRGHVSCSNRLGGMLRFYHRVAA
jgi:hypothetical protein